jgi:hypothetical protein
MSFSNGKPKKEMQHQAEDSKMRNLTYSPSKNQKRYAQLWAELELPKLLQNKEVKS